jgi:hypothetical protein
MFFSGVSARNNSQPHDNRAPLFSKPLSHLGFAVGGHFVKNVECESRDSKDNGADGLADIEWVGIGHRAWPPHCGRKERAAHI